MRRAFPWLILGLCGCGGGPGLLIDGSGLWPLRTARYRIGIRDGAPELALVLSNGDFACGLPSFPSDPERQARETEALLAAACREGARHASLRLYQRDEDWVGAFVGADHAEAADLTSERPRLARAAYYGVDEAVLIEFDGLTRGYAALEEIWLPVLGDGGEVRIEEKTGSALRGWFSFPDEDLSGEFEATRCAGDTSLIDVIAAAPVHFCQ